MVGYWLKLAHAPTLLYSWPAEDPDPLGFLFACVFVVVSASSSSSSFLVPEVEMSRITFGLRLVSPFKPYSRVAEDSVFCFLRVAAVVVVVAVCSCLSSYSSLRSRNESHVWF